MSTATAVKTAATVKAVVSNTHDSPPETTRIFVSGLPPNFTNDQLASHFRSQFKVTDAHVFADRRIGFVGFTDTASAQNAVKHFNRSYIRMSKIAVELARPVEVVKDSRGHAASGSKRGQKSVQDMAGVKRKRGEQDDGEQLRTEESKRPAPQQPGTAAGASTGVDEQETSSDLVEETATARTDNDWLRGRTNRTLDLMDPDDITIQQAPEPIKPTTSPRPQEVQASSSSDPPEQEDDTIQVTNARLFLRNLAFTVTENDLRDRFRQYGKIHEVGRPFPFPF